MSLPWGPACLDLVGLHLIHPQHPMKPDTPVTGLLWGHAHPFLGVEGSGVGGLFIFLEIG